MNCTVKAKPKSTLRDLGFFMLIILVVSLA
jgi:hypothetical protein